MQLAHEVASMAPGVELYEPAAHITQTTDPGALHEPRAQQTPEPAELYEGGSEVHGEARTDPGRQKVLAGQVPLHTAALSPSVAPWVPAGHNVGALAPAGQ